MRAVGIPRHGGVEMCSHAAPRSGCIPGNDRRDNGFVIAQRCTPVFFVLLRSAPSDFRGDDVNKTHQNDFECTVAGQFSNRQVERKVGFDNRLASFGAPQGGESWFERQCPGVLAQIQGRECRGFQFEGGTAYQKVRWRYILLPAMHRQNFGQNIRSGQGYNGLPSLAA